MEQRGLASDGVFAQAPMSAARTVVPGSATDNYSQRALRVRSFHEQRPELGALTEPDRA